jgi:DNA-binding beta-propeller fold protein YncE
MCSRITISILALACGLLSSCASEEQGTFPPKDHFPFPVSVDLVETDVPGEGVLYVVNSNFNLRYNRGSVIAVDLAKLQGNFALPVTRAIDLDNGFVYIDNFAGDVAAFTPAAGAKRFLYVPTRFQNRLYTVRADGTHLSCNDPLPGEPDPRDCLDLGLSLGLTEKERTEQPFGAAIQGKTLYVTPLRPSDSPAGSGRNDTAFMAKLTLSERGLPPASTTPSDFISLGDAPAEALAAVPPSATNPTPNGIWVGGLSISSSLGTSQTLRFFDGQNVSDLGVSTSTRIQEARGVAPSTDGQRLYLTTRGPDGILVLDISAGPETSKPLSFTPILRGPSFIQPIGRATAGKRDLVAVSCTDDNALVLYDDELGQVTGVVPGIEAPFGMAKGVLPGHADGVRLFVAAFGNDTVEVVDIPDTSDPRGVVRASIGFPAHRPLGTDPPPLQ